MNKEIPLTNRRIGASHPPFIIAEMSGNHNQSLDRALAIVDAAAKAGAHAMKLQTYTADTMTLDIATGGFRIDDPNSLWNKETLYELYKKAHTPWEWHAPIFERCRKHGIIPFSTPFDETAVDFLEELNVELYKIASFENTDVPLLRKVAGTGKPIIISTGMATIAELDECVRTLRGSGCNDIILLKCTSSYPATPVDSNLHTIPHLRSLFNVPVGLSDHTMGIGVAIAAVALGATVIEKHFTLDRADGGVDSVFSMEPDELAGLVVETERAWQALGSIHYGLAPSESASLKFRRSLYVVKDMEKGDMITKENLRAIRPGYGLAPKYMDLILGKRVKCAVKRGTPASLDIIG